MVKKIDGAAIAEKIKDDVAKEIFAFGEDRPSLAIVLVGERPDSKLYVSLKEREGKKVGVDTHLYALEADTPETEVIEVIRFLSGDPNIDGILVQLPLPDGFDTDKVIAAIDPNKDVDGFHPDHPEFLQSPVIASVGACLDEIGFKADGQSASVLYNSEVFGQSIKDALTARGLQVLPAAQSAEADVLVTALGEPHKIKRGMIKSDSVLIDIGITTVGREVQGDVDWDDIAAKAAWATPVPGGIGPMTVAFLFRNVLEIFKKNRR